MTPVMRWTLSSDTPILVCTRNHETLNHVSIGTFVRSSSVPVVTLNQRRQSSSPPPSRLTSLSDEHATPRTREAASEPHHLEIPDSVDLRNEPPVELFQVLWVMAPHLGRTVIDFPSGHRSTIDTRCSTRTRAVIEEYGDRKRTLPRGYENSSRCLALISRSVLDGAPAL